MAKMIASYNKWVETGGPEEEVSRGQRLGTMLSARIHAKNTSCADVVRVCGACV
jgi:hypothetical protein